MPHEAAAASDLPAYMVDILRDLAGASGQVSNATGMFMNPDDGLRLFNEPEQIAQFEYAATIASEGVRQVLQHIRPGVTEDELEHFFDARGLPLSCHRMINFGSKAQRGLSSPSSRRASLGDAYTAAFGVIGSLTCRAGCVATEAADLPDAATRDFYPRFAANYFAVVAAWYAAVRVGACAGDVFQAVESRRDANLFDFALNPGHYIHLDEWLHSPFAQGSRTTLKSGAALQMDIIPISRGPFCCANAEDTVVLADESLRDQLRGSSRSAGRESRGGGRSCKKNWASRSMRRCSRWETRPVGCHPMSWRRNRRSCNAPPIDERWPRLLPGDASLQQIFAALALAEIAETLVAQGDRA